MTNATYTNTLIYAFIAAAASANWIIRTRKPVTPMLASVITERYPSVPEEFLQFLSIVEEAMPVHQSACLICEPHFNGTSGYATRWNEWELFDYDTFQSDSTHLKAINHFWNQHLPVAVSMRSDLAYLAIDLSKEHYGQIVYGASPAFLEPRQLFDSFSGLLVGITKAIQMNSAGTAESITPWQLVDFV